MCVRVPGVRVVGHGQTTTSKEVAVLRRTPRYLVRYDVNEGNMRKEQVHGSPTHVTNDSVSLD